MRSFGTDFKAHLMCSIIVLGERFLYKKTKGAK